MHCFKSHPVCPLPASIEILPSQIPTSDQLRTLLSAGTHVYLTDIGTPAVNSEMLVAAQRLRDVGCNPVPHLAARRIRSREALEKCIKEFAELAGVNNVLVVGGGIATPLGPYKSTMDILETGFLDRFGIQDIAVAGHPEGSPDFTEALAIEALRQKQAFAERTGARLRIVTQFCFDPARALAWAASLAKVGVDLPVHIGVAGPAKFATLIRYATLCGVGNSLSMLTRSAGNIMSLATGYSPETFVSQIEKELATLARPTISQMHIFPFGGLENASSWLAGGDPGKPTS
ncbi:methylenetetrahydrofolate reductase (plasmid) [Brucella intermedia]|uniref:methylenetetrahydrofolate reductase n=1 Tax=Brucella intermedia TaxID=94625 RepID=UPI0027360658|nr:methylenetetrahydrofolate reductase [Brucella intermedia]WLF99649.1 methylenetetrahydrofolate reductase [Brucella intermedia]